MRMLLAEDWVASEPLGGFVVDLKNPFSLKQ